MAFGRKRDERGSVEDEREQLYQQRLALDELKRELAARVRAVQEREAELRDAIEQTARGNGSAAASVLPPVDRGSSVVALDNREAQLQQRERSVAERERALAERGAAAPDTDTDESALAAMSERERQLEQRERELAAREQELDARSVAVIPSSPEMRLAELDTRLAELKTAEKAFLRTQHELAARSEAVAAREQLVAQRERELDEREDSWGAPDLSDLEARLRRLETQPAPGEQTLGFSGGMKKLQKQGTRKTVPPSS